MTGGMIIGLGNDIVDIRRIEKVREKDLRAQGLWDEDA